MSAAPALRNEPAAQVAILAFSGEMDKLFAALAIANAAAAAGMEVTIFFTFWGLSAIRRQAGALGKGFLDRLLGWMTPVGCGRLPVSRMNFGGLGASFFRWLMRERNVQDLESLLADAQDLGVRLVACQTSLHVMGVRREELLEGVEFGGVAKYVEIASRAKINLCV